MDSAAEAEFSALAHTAALALWPGSVRIAGTNYACSLTRGPVEITLAGRAGVQRVEGLMVEVAKTVLATAPALETVVKDLADGQLFSIKQIDGSGAADAVWFLVCAQHKT